MGGVVQYPALPGLEQPNLTAPQRTELQNAHLAYYDDGASLWNVYTFVNLEQQLQAHAGSADVLLFDAHRRGRPRQPRTDGCENDAERREKRLKGVVHFRGHRDLTWLQPEPAWVSYTPVFAATDAAPAAAAAPADLAAAAFQQQREALRTSLAGDRIRALVRSLRLPARITKLVCLGLGEFLHRAAGDGAGDGSSSVAVVVPGDLEGFGPAAQHAAALLLREELMAAGRNQPAPSTTTTSEAAAGSGVALVAQDPAYSEGQERVLGALGFKVVGRHGAQGFAEVDDHTFVFSYDVGMNLREVLAEYARPAVIVCAWDDDAPEGVAADDYVRLCASQRDENGNPTAW
ncbi:hypothetical protein F4780DRAFT_787834 [Xylariomycetidae sp. FL0641]|nr:hypothetical protein F4780DRAFT_787834 [Xylariomycetidae sp. FL0641]